VVLQTHREHAEFVCEALQSKGLVATVERSRGWKPSKTKSGGGGGSHGCRASMVRWNRPNRTGLIWKPSWNSPKQFWKGL